MFDCIPLSVLKFTFLTLMCIVIKNSEDDGNNNLRHAMQKYVKEEEERH